MPSRLAVDAVLIIGEHGNYPRSGIPEACLASRHEGQKRMETPHLAVRYRAPVQSRHCRT